MREPGVHAELARRREPRPDEPLQRRAVLRVRHDAPEEPRVVVSQLERGACFVEVLGLVLGVGLGFAGGGFFVRGVGLVVGGELVGESDGGCG